MKLIMDSGVRRNSCENVAREIRAAPLESRYDDRQQKTTGGVMNAQIYARGLAAALALLSSIDVTGCAITSNDKSISIVDQGSFFVGGRKVQAPGTYDPTKSAAGTDEGQ